VSSPAVAIIAATVATPPLNLRKQAASQTSIQIVWDAPLSDGSTPITDFNVWWDNGAENGVYVELTASTGNLLTYTVSTGLVTGNSYSFKVRAKNFVGQSAYSEVLVVVAALLPGQPTAPTKFSASISQITIRWTKPDENGSTITKYNVYWNEGDGSTFVKVGDSTVLQF